MLFFVLLYLIIIIHECSHALAVILFGQEVKKIQLGAFSLFDFEWKWKVAKPFPVVIGLFPFIGFCSFDPKTLSNKQKIVVALAGPIGNIVFGLIGVTVYYMAFKHTGIVIPLKEALNGVVAPFVGFANYIAHFGYVLTPTTKSTVAAISVHPLLQFSMLSLSIAGFNLFPLFPLDGGHILVNSYEAAMKKEFPKRAKNIMLIIALFVLIIFPLLRPLIQAFR